MTTIFRLLKDFHTEESGQGLVEYLLIIALVGLAVVSGMSGAASKIASAFSIVGSKLSSAVGT